MQIHCKRSFCVAVLLWPILCIFSVSTFAQNSRPNVIIILTDDQGYGDMACHGNPIIKTPNLDKLYTESTRFTNFHVSPTCAPTRAALMTGRYANRTGVWHTIGGRSLLRKDEKTIANIFSENNYSTAIFGKWHLGDNYPYRPEDRGFQETLVHGAGGIGQVPDFFDNDYYDDTYLYSGKPKKYKGYCTDVWFEEAMNYIENQKNQPFFCYISTNAPHSPFYVDDTYSDLYRGFPNVPSKEFYGMITNFDDNIGLLMNKLEDLKITDNTILIFITDNGSAMGEHKSKKINPYNAGMRGKKNSEYDGGHRVPFFIRWKNGNIEAGRDISQISSHIDVLPTLIDLCNLEDKDQTLYDGKSLVPLLNNESHQWSDRILITDSQRLQHPIKWRKSAVMSDKFRLVNGIELYNIIEDPSQQNDIAEQHQEIVKQYKEVYEDWWGDVSERFDEYAGIIVGSKFENPVHITSHDWHSESQVPWHQRHVRAGIQENGFWVLDVEEPGEYEITLSRWPLHLQHPISSGKIERLAITGTSVEESKRGKVLAITKAKIKFGKQYLDKKVGKDDFKVSFKIKLKSGEGQRFQSWFEGEQINMGAYYIKILKE